MLSWAVQGLKLSKMSQLAGERRRNGAVLETQRMHIAVTANSGIPVCGSEPQTCIKGYHALEGVPSAANCMPALQDDVARRVLA